jgi:regulator of sirC expression with transglutaminase-like and TPR domain
MDREAVQLRRLAQTIHQRRVQQQLIKSLEGDEAAVDLFHAALLIALLDNDEVDVAGYRSELDRLARDLAASLPSNADEPAKLAGLNKFLFAELGFHGSRGDYYHRSNSYVNEVFDDREGLPITLSVIYMELGRRLGLKVVGVGLPGHFVVRHEPAAGESQLIDVFERGEPLSRANAEKLIRAAAGRAPRESDFAAAGKRAIVSRMLHNLLGLAQRAQDADGMLRYVDTLIAISPESWEERWMRAVLLFRAGRRDESLRETDWLVDHRPEGLDLKPVEDLRRMLAPPPAGRREGQ